MMQAYIYWTKAACYTQAQWEAVLPYIPPEKRARIARMTGAARQAAIAAEHLLQYACKVHLGCIPPAEARRVTPKGKPYFAEVPLQFSLSHSGGYALAAVSEGDIGADIQVISPNPKDILRIADRWFGPEEWAWMTALPAEAEARFYRLWTCKESMAKLLGAGLRKDLPPAADANGLLPACYTAREGAVFLGGCTAAEACWQQIRLSPAALLQQCGGM